MVRHNSNIADMSMNIVLVQHIVSHPGHGFKTSEAKLIWKTHSKYESQLVEASCISQFPSCNISKGEIRVSHAMASFTTHIAGLRKQLGNNTSPNGLGSTTSLLPPPAPTHALPTHFSCTPASPTVGLPLSQPTSSGNDVLRPTQNSSIQYPSASASHGPAASVSHGSISTTSISSHSSHVLPSCISPHSSTSSSQPLTAVYHRSLRRILNQEQHITTSPRRLRSRYKPFLSQQ